LVAHDPSNLPPVHLAVTTFCRIKWRQDDIFAKNKFGIYF